MLLHTKAMLLIRGISFLLDYFALDCFAPSKLMGANGFSSRTRIGYMQYALSNIIMSSAYPFILAAFVLDYMFLMLSRFWLKFFRWGRVDRALSVRQLCRLILILIIFFLPYVFGADEPSSSRLPVFKGTKAAFAMWLMSFLGYVALKDGDIISMLEGDEEEPIWENDDEDYVQADVDSWTKRNRALYGYLIMAMPPALKGTLNTHTKYDGLASLARLKARFSVVDANDRTDALSRIMKSYISPGAAPSTKDISRQFEMMMAAHAEYESAGGAPLDDELLRAYFFNSLPNTYDTPRMLVKNDNDSYADLSAVYDAFLGLVKGM